MPARPPPEGGEAVPATLKGGEAVPATLKGGEAVPATLKGDEAVPATLKGERGYARVPIRVELKSRLTKKLLNRLKLSVSYSVKLRETVIGERGTGEVYRPCYAFVGNGAQGGESICLVPLESLSSYSEIGRNPPFSTRFS